MIKRNSKGQFVKGSEAYWKGKKFTEEYRDKLSKAHIGIQAGEKHPLWKGEKSSYQTKHDFVRRRLGTPMKCDMCGTTKAKVFDWANISNLYKKELSDWLRLCRKCHYFFDVDIKGGRIKWQSK